MKKKIKVELTEAQAKWLYHILGRAFDGYFEGNPRERSLCDNCEEKVSIALDEAGITQNFMIRTKSKMEKIK